MEARIWVLPASGAVALCACVFAPEMKAQASAVRPASGIAEQHGTQPCTSPGPALITTMVQSHYFASRDAGMLNIDVSTSGQGVVSLSGVVHSAGERQKAVQIARATDGVTGVNDELRVTRPADGGATATPTVNDLAAALRDAWITSQVESRLFIDPDVKGRTIEVDTKDGVVTLRGGVGSAYERSRALAAARETDGVVEVLDDMRLVNAEAERARMGGRIDDAWILTKLQSEFFADAGLRQQPIRIESHAGVVTLSGRVTEPELKQAAEEMARETAGVVRVVNHLSGPSD